MKNIGMFVEYDNKRFFIKRMYDELIWRMTEKEKGLLEKIIDENDCLYMQQVDAIAPRGCFIGLLTDKQMEFLFQILEKYKRYCNENMCDEIPNSDDNCDTIDLEKLRELNRSIREKLAKRFPNLMQYYP